VQVMTPTGEVDLIEPGSYHIDAGHPDGDTPPANLVVTVLQGKAEASGPRQRIDIVPGETATISGNPQSIALTEGGTTPFDDWALQRERREVAVATPHYVSPSTTGYQDLDDNGQWNNDPDYGAVWYPTSVPADWAPYRYGHWAWVPPWGWTWVDDAPWGFAPFHYGRWVSVGDRWGWCPGDFAARPVYAPALVAFIGGAGFGIAISAGEPLEAVGWVPLAPREEFHPYYHSSPTYVRNVNITNVSINRTVVNNVTNVTVINKDRTVVNHFANQRAATVVPSAAFTRAAPVQRAAVVVPREQLAQAQVTQTVAHLRPTDAARAGVGLAAAASVVPRANAPAALAKVPVVAAATPPGGTEPQPPKAPGPSFAPRDHRGEPPTGQKPATVPQFAHVPPPAAATPPSPPAHPAVTTAVPPSPSTGTPTRHDERAAHPTGAIPPSAPSRPAVTTATPPKPPTPPLQPQHPPAVAAVRPPPPAPQFQRAVQPPKPPVAQIERPVQQTHLTPTPQGWTRVQAPPPSAPPHANPAPAHANPPPPKKDEHKPNG